MEERCSRAREGRIETWLAQEGGGTTRAQFHQIFMLGWKGPTLLTMLSHSTACRSGVKLGSWYTVSPRGWIYIKAAEDWGSKNPILLQFSAICADGPNHDYIFTACQSMLLLLSSRSGHISPDVASWDLTLLSSSLFLSQAMDRSGHAYPINTASWRLCPQQKRATLCLH